MKPSLLILPVLCLVQIPLLAQVTVVPTSPATPSVVVVQPPSSIVVQQPAIIVRTLDSAVVQRQLSLAPKVMVVTPAPQTAVKTTKTTTVVDTPGLPRRVYNSERSIVVVEDQGQTRELALQREELRE